MVEVEDPGELVPVRVDMSSRESIAESWNALGEDIDVLFHSVICDASLSGSASSGRLQECSQTTCVGTGIWVVEGM